VVKVCVGVHSDYCSVQTRGITTDYNVLSVEQDLKHAAGLAT